MNYNDVKRLLLECPGLLGLDDVSQAFLLRHGDELCLSPGEIIYAEGADLDDSFCVLLTGSVTVEKGGRLVAEISKSQVFGEMAYFSSSHKRIATVRASSEKTSVLKILLPPGNLGLPAFSSLKRILALQPWLRSAD